jgi:hypothetical protein
LRRGDALRYCEIPVDGREASPQEEPANGRDFV